MAHPAAIGAKDEIPGSAIPALPAGYSCGAEAGDTLADLYALHVLSDFDHGPGKLMAESYGGGVAKGIVQYMDIGSAYSTKCDLYLNVIVAANWFVDISDSNIAFACGIFH
jgi:hypothetical protein